MDLWGTLLLVVAANLDNLGVGMSLGVRRIRVPFTSNLLIALITSCGTLLTLLAGKWLAEFMSLQVARYTGSLIIIGMGIWVLYQELDRLRSGPDRNSATEQGPLVGQDSSRVVFDADYSGHIDFKEAFFLGVALSLNNFAGGFGAGIFGLNPVLIFVVVVVLSLLLLWAGIHLGKNCFSHWLGGLAGPVSGVVLIVIGSYTMFV